MKRPNCEFARSVGGGNYQLCQYESVGTVELGTKRKSNKHYACANHASKFKKTKITLFEEETN